MDTPNMHLVARKLFGGHGGSKNHTCPAPDTNGPTIVPLFGSMSFKTFSTVVAGATSIVTILLALTLVLRHATHYTIPKEQRQIIRIGCFLPWVTIFAFLSVAFESKGLYIAPGIDIATALALSSFLLLLCNYVLSNPDGLQDLFGNDVYTAQSPAWLKRSWYMVLQFIPVSVILWIATAASLAAGTYCSNSNSIYFVHIWVTVIRGFCTGMAVMSIFRFHKIMHAKLAPHKIMMKFFAFKGVIVVMFIQAFLISILVSSKVIKPTSHLTYNNIQVGVPNLLLCCELPFFSAFILYAYRVTPYSKAKLGSPKYGAFAAIIQALNYTDILSAFFKGPMKLIKDQEGVKGRDGDGMMPLIAPPAYNNAQPIAYNRQSNGPHDYEYHGVGA
ncbi:uncharacterized protein BDZ99DRAFT_468590 [Mytilinidion resinicola]|uniref:DUF300-domain-containing protein n=1 Tax=Mytilinidion resinicola TaxID=574789 RepID=A0A6A6Y3W7_9PEZI|nr:uncharacterized protein BDZ99DRAFT_468590 [Mytilinidion resinicola]KAF2802925.1 hypothetical protein BDZ99DRAFT_468590 [Mytilinidion resinicola]